MREVEILKKKQLKCYLYTRVSTSMQVDGYSLDAQRDKLRKYAAYEDMIVAGEYSDEGFSGKNIQGRQEFQRMLNDIQDGKDDVSYVLVFKLSRFGRNAADVLNSLQLMQDFGVNLICVEDGIDSSKDAGKLMISVLSAVAEIERENIRTQTMAGREQKAREGKWNGGFAPYGYKLENGNLVIAEDEVEVIRVIYDRYIHTNEGVAGVAKYLNRNGYTKKLRQNNTIPGFSRDFVKNVLYNPVYMGKIAYGRRRTEKKQGTRNEMHVVEQSEFPVYEGQHEAIISEEDWYLAQEKRKINSFKREKVNNPDHAHILSGILKCPCCGKSMYGNIAKAHSKDKKTRYYYYCKNTVTPTGHECSFRLNIEQTEINKFVAKVISAMVNNPRFVEAIQAKIGTAVDTEDMERQIAVLQGRLKQAFGTKSRLERQMDTLDINDAHYDRKILDLQRRYDEQYDTIEEIEVQIGELQSQIRSIQQEKISGDNIYRLLLAFDEVYHSATEAEQKEFMKAFIERIEMFPEKRKDGSWIKKIVFNFPVPVDGEEVKELPLETETTVELRNGLGTLSAKDVPTEPTDMTPDNEHKTPGTWDILPNTNADGISETGNYVYTYTFPPKNKCTVTYHWVSTENPDSAVLPAPETVTEDTTYTVETVPDIKGWTFSGWYDKVNWTDTDETVKPGTYSSTGQNIDLYDKWTHKECYVTFLADYADYMMPERGSLNVGGQTVSEYKVQVPYGSTLQNAVKSLPTPVPGGENQWFFKSWDLEADGSEDLFYTDPDVLDMPVRSNLTFVAQWWPIVTFDANGGAWSSGETIETMQYVKIQTDTKKVAAASTPVRNGYTFLGWYTDDGVRANFEDTVNGPKTLYAHWAKNAAVTFRIVNGTWSGGAAEDKTVTVVLYPQADGTASGTLDASYVPQIMLPAPGYENIAGGWEQTPNTDPNGITGDVTYVYRFGSTGGGSSSGHSTRYTLHYESNGGTAYKDERCSSGTKVTLDKTPTRESYTFTGWYADRALTQKITSVTMNSDKTVYAGWEATGVPDKLNGDDHFAYVVGYSDGTVRPSANISRAEVATIFFRLLKSDIRDGNLTADNEFSDVSDGQWHNKAISTMAKLGIVKGRRADRFDPDASITRAEFAAICARFNTKPVENSGSFSDISGHWAENEIERAAAFGWISGYPNGTFRPDARITRAEAMTMINRVLCRMPQSKSDLLDSMVTWPDNKPSDWHYLAVQEATNSHDFDRQGEVGESWTKLTSVPDWTRYQ